ncbi:MAG: hypothetical protein V4710_10470 [Verrucomicrobiota bacterium]
MKRHSRRSAWLGFVACGLIGTSLCRAESPLLPLLSISKASAAAEAELQKRGLAENHVIASVSLSKEKSDAYYVARIEPPIAVEADFESKQCTAFKIDMAGGVTLQARA